MAKEKKPVARNRDLGTVASKEASGFWLTSKGDKIPAIHGIKIGDKIKMENDDYVINGGKGEEAEPTEATDLAGVNEKIAALEAELVEVKTELSGVKAELAGIQARFEVEPMPKLDTPAEEV